VYISVQLLLTQKYCLFCLWLIVSFCGEGYVLGWHQTDENNVQSNVQVKTVLFNLLILLH